MTYVKKAVPSPRIAGDHGCNGRYLSLLRVDSLEGLLRRGSSKHLLLFPLMLLTLKETLYAIGAGKPSLGELIDRILRLGKILLIECNMLLTLMHINYRGRDVANYHKQLSQCRKQKESGYRLRKLKQTSYA